MNNCCNWTVHCWLDVSYRCTIWRLLFKHLFPLLPVIGMIGWSGGSSWFLQEWTCSFHFEPSTCTKSNTYRFFPFLRMFIPMIRNSRVKVHGRWSNGFGCWNAWISIRYFASRGCYSSVFSIFMTRICIVKFLLLNTFPVRLNKLAKCSVTTLKRNRYMQYLFFYKKNGTCHQQNKNKKHVKTCLMILQHERLKHDWWRHKKQKQEEAD